MSREILKQTHSSAAPHQMSLPPTVFRLVVMKVDMQKMNTISFVQAIHQTPEILNVYRYPSHSYVYSQILYSDNACSCFSRGHPRSSNLDTPRYMILNSENVSQVGPSPGVDRTLQTRSFPFVFSVGCSTGC